MAVTRIGVVGVGNMGLPMALRLQNHGYAVTVFDTDAGRAEQATRHRLRVAPSAAEAAIYSRCTIVAVDTSEQVEAALFGPEGAAQTLRAGDCVMLCSNQPPQAVEAQASDLLRHNVQCIDAPLSGGPDFAGWGTVPMLLACDPAIFERHRPMVEALSSRVIRVGARVGMASHAIMVNNLAAAVNLAGMSEAMALARKLGLDPRLMLEIIESSSGQSWVGSERFSRLLRGDVGLRLRIDQAGRDARQSALAAASLGLDTPLAAAAARQYEDACVAGWAGADDSVLFDFVRGEPEVEDVPSSPVKVDVELDVDGYDIDAPSKASEPIDIGSKPLPTR